MPKSLVHFNPIPYNILHVLLEKIGIIFQNLLAFLIHEIKEVIEMKAKTVCRPIPPLLHDRPPILQPPLRDLQAIDKLPPLQPRQGYLLLNCLKPLSYGFDIMRSMLLEGKTRNAKKSIITRKTDDAKLLLRMNLAKCLVEPRFGTIAPRVEPFPKWSNFLRGLIMRLELLIAGAH